MTDSGFTAERIAHARRSMRAALKNWNTADLSQAGLCRELLEESVMDLRAIEGFLRSGKVDVPDTLRRELLEMKREISQAVRLVDAGLAFYRGLALRMGCSAPSYSPHGRIVEEATTIGQRGMQA